MPIQEDALRRFPEIAKDETATAERRRRAKQRGILLATGGLLMGLGVMLALRAIGLAEFETGQWSSALVATLAVMAVLWLVPRLGLDRRLTWDWHYLYVPMTAAALLLGLYIYIAPVGRYLLLMGWFVGLVFMAGVAGFFQVLVLGGIMTASYLGAVALLVTQGAELALSYEVIQAFVFLAIQAYAGFVFQRLRRDRREMKELRRELAEQAVTDPLTGVANRRYFEEFLQAEIARIERYGGTCSVALIDVDHFKNYNDTLGHVAGDGVLQELADLLRSLSRESDVVARYGGEEFAVVMPHTERGEAEGVVERLRRRVEGHGFSHESVQPGEAITVSAGLAGVPVDAETFRDIIDRADEALYRAKRAGRNRVEISSAPPGPPRVEVTGTEMD